MNQSQTTKTMEDAEIDIVPLLLFFWKRKAWIFAGMAGGLVVGIIYLLITPKLYYTESIIATKESSQNKSPGGLLGQIGGLGGVVASQLGIGNNNLDHIEIMIHTKAMAESVISYNHLDPMVFAGLKGTKSIFGRAKQPMSVEQATDALRDFCLKVGINNKKSTMSVGIIFKDPETSAKIVKYYTDALNRKIQEDVRVDADSNIKFLESQLNLTPDPLLREKIQNLISNEIEKSMLVNSSSLKVLAYPEPSNTQIKPNRKSTIMVSLVLGFCLSAFGLIILKAFESRKSK